MDESIVYKNSYLRKLPVALAALTVLFVLIPLVLMFRYMDAESVQAVLSRDALGLAVGRSVVASLLTTVISLVLAYLFAWCMERTAIPGKKVFRILIILPMLIPSVSIGMGAVMLMGNSGILTNLLGLQSGNVYGLKGIVWGSVIYSLPVAFLMIDNILKYEDSSPYEAAEVLGIPKWNQFTAITLPYLRKPMIAAAFSVFTLSFTDYGVPLMVGGKYKTLPILMYQEVIGQLNFGKGCVYGSILLVPAIVAFLVDLSTQNSANGGYVTRSFEIMKKKGRDTIAMLFSVALSVFSVLPILSFMVIAFVRKYPADMSVTFANITKTLQMGGDRFLMNSVVVAVSVAVIGVVLAIFTAYVTARTQLRFTRYLHLICMSTGAVPGIVLGLAYVLFFKGSVVYGTLIVLIMVNTVHFFSSPYLMMYNSFLKVNENLEIVAATMGIGRKRLLKDILLPRCKKTVAEMFSYFFVNCMMTISAVSFLATSRTKPIALMINQFEAQAQLEAAAVVSLAILLINLLVKALMEWNPKGIRG